MLQTHLVLLLFDYKEINNPFLQWCFSWGLNRSTINAVFCRYQTAGTFHVKWFKSLWNHMGLSSLEQLWTSSSISLLSSCITVRILGLILKGLCCSWSVPFLLRKALVSYIYEPWQFYCGQSHCISIKQTCANASFCIWSPSIFFFTSLLL